MTDKHVKVSTLSEEYLRAETPPSPLGEIAPGPSTTLQHGEVDITRLANDGRHFARVSPHGLMELVDSLTGETKIIFGADQLGERVPVLETRLINGKEVKVETTVTPGQLKSTKPTIFHPWIVDRISQMIAEGGNLTKICQQEDMPAYHVLMSWKRAHPHIQKQLDEARLDRTEYLRDKVLDIAESHEDYKFPSQAAKIKIDALQWASGVDNPKYSAKAKIEATLNVPTQIIVSTGIDRSPLPEQRQVTQVEEEVRPQAPAPMAKTPEPLAPAIESALECAAGISLEDIDDQSEF